VFFVLNFDIIVIMSIKKVLKMFFISKYYLYNCKKLFAFTLAEVLITLLIIGVVASIVIPNLIQDSQEKELHVAYKKGLSTFTQAFARIRMDNGGTLAGVFQFSITSFQNQFSPYLNISKYSYTVRPGGPNETWHDYQECKKLNGDIAADMSCHNCPSGRFQDGSLFMIFYSGTRSNLNTCNTAGTYPKDGLCFNIAYDVNGKKPPNVFGRDIYILSVYRDKVVPADWILDIGSTNESSCSTSSSGYGCAIKYAKE